MSLQDQYDEAMFDFSTGDNDSAVAKLQGVLREDPGCFDAQLALGMVFYRQGNYAAALAEGHRAEQLRPEEPLVHTNLSLFYLKSGDKLQAEQHGLKARITSWKAPGAGSGPAPANAELEMAKPPPATGPPLPMPDRPWKKKRS